MLTPTRFLDGIYRRRSVHHQGGFALMVVIFVLMLVSLLVVALIGLSFSTAVFSADQTNRDNRARVADVALQTSVNEIARDPTGNLGFPYKVNPSGAVVDQDSCSVDRPTTGGDPELSVYVECIPITPAESATGDGSVTGGLVGTESTDLVKVIGSTNGGDQAGTWRTAAWPWASTIVDNPATAATETYAGPAKQAIDTYNATLLHRGSEPLSFTSNLDVSQGSAALRDPVLANPNGFDSAINVSGGYWQGLPGLFSTGAEQDPNTDYYNAAELSNSCGLLQPVNSFWQIWGAGMRTGSSMACSQDGSVKTIPNPSDPDDPYKVPQRDSLHTTWQTTGVTPKAPKVNGETITWTPDQVEFYKQTAPSCPPVDGTATLYPGSYNRIETAKLNAMWKASGAGSCPGRTWIFQPGQYWLDVAPATTSTDPERNALVIDDPGAKIVFGTPVSPLTAASFPDACDPTQPGAVVTLTARTSIRHKRGRLAMCGADTSEGRQAIWQSSGGNLGWVTSPSDTTGTGGDFDTNPDGALYLNDGQLAEASFPCATSGWAGDTCSGLRELTITNLGGDDDAGSAPVDSLQAVVSARALDSNNRGANIKFTIKPRADRGGGQCSMTYDPMPDNFEVYAYELMNPAGSCDELIKDRSQLVGATLTASFDLQTTCWALCLTGSAAVQVDYLGLRLPWTPQPASANYSGGSAYSNSGNIMKLDGLLAKKRVECDSWFFPWLTCTGSTTGIVEMNNFQDLSSPDMSGTAQAGTALRSVFVVVTGYAENVDLGSSRTTLTVKRSDGSVLCANQYSGVPGGHSRYGSMPQVYDLKKPPSITGNCAAQLSSASQLIGTSLQIRSDIRKSGDCSVVLTWVGYRDCSGWGAYIDHVSMSTTSYKTVADPNSPTGQAPDSASSYGGPTSSFLVTSNNDAGGTDDALASFAGEVSTPRADLDIHWDGPFGVGIAGLPSAGSMAVKPIFSGTGGHALTVNSINSSGSGTVGVLCCKPAKPSEREVQLVAHLGDDATGPVIATARVLFFDVSTSPDSAGTWAPGQRVTIQDWRSCPAGVATKDLCAST